VNQEAQAGPAPVAGAAPAAAPAAVAAAAAAVHLRGLHAAAAPNARQVVLHGIDLELAPGEQVAVIGASGSGKTTLLRCVNHLELPSAGTVDVDGREVRLRAVSQFVETWLMCGNEHISVGSRTRVCQTSACWRIYRRSCSISLVFDHKRLSESVP